MAGDQLARGHNVWVTNNSQSCPWGVSGTDAPALGLGTGCELAVRQQLQLGNCTFAGFHPQQKEKSNLGSSGRVTLAHPFPWANLRALRWPRCPWDSPRHLLCLPRELVTFCGAAGERQHLRELSRAGVGSGELSLGVKPLPARTSLSPAQTFHHLGVPLSARGGRQDQTHEGSPRGGHGGDWRTAMDKIF